jgi:uncharacterized protein YdhG (YjbR/CyaY superfamily)
MWQCPKCGRDFKKLNQNHYCSGNIAANNGKLPAAIDEYINMQPKEVRPVLDKIRETIKKSAPKAEEKISWQMPTFWQSENLIHFAAFKKHIGIYPGSECLVHFEKKLSGYKTSKGAVQLPLDKPIDYNLIREITKFRVSSVQKKVNKNEKTP